MYFEKIVGNLLVESLIRERHLHEISLDECLLGRKLCLLSIMCSPINLVIVVVETSNMAPSESCDFSGRSSNTTSDIQNLVSILDTNLCSEVVFVASNGSVETFTVCESAEME